MDFDDPGFINSLQDAMRNIGEHDPRWRPRRRDLEPPRQVHEFKVTELPEFLGGTDPEAYLEWERKIDRMFDFKDLDDEKRCKYAILKLSRGSLLWFEGVKTQRARVGKAKKAYWETLKRRLRKSIANSVELYPYADFDTLCGLCLKHETQSKARYGGSNVEHSRANTWTEPDSSSKFGGSSSGPIIVPKHVSLPAPNHNSNPKTTVKPRETSLTKVWCFKCQGFGHYQSACPNKRVVSLTEAVSTQSELLNEEEKERIGDIFKFNECEDKEEEVEAGSCANVASSEMVKKLGLNTTAHPRPYEIHWLDDGSEVKVSKQVRVGLTMGPYNDEVFCDVIPMDACLVLLGHPWQFDREVIHHGRTNEHELRDKGKRIVLKPMSPQAIRETSTSRGKKPNLSVFASKREIEHDIDGGHVLMVNETRGWKPVERHKEKVEELLHESADVFPDYHIPRAKHKRRHKRKMRPRTVGPYINDIAYKKKLQRECGVPAELRTIPFEGGGNE
ncbi:hypothetical protein RND81_13G077100 [Saponaria officinalis]|uniref:CCHC-type domain-containing protein n=1 Tax=Saponaria officinalis TaxID=3572 RepID=A0AAW1GY96_SAPOF